jgi:chemotaxis protein methyltransferase CheR
MTTLMPTRISPSSLTTPAELHFSDSDMKLFQEMMYRETGIRLADAKQNLVQSRLRKRVEALQLPSFSAYHAYVTAPGHQDEFQACLEALTTNETFFFRHKQHWDFLLGTIMPHWRQQVPASADFRAWSAASSTGEEAYSLAIALTAGLSGSAHGVHIDATDINTQVLERAARGIYSAYALQKLTPRCLKQYFTKLPDNSGHQVQEQLRRLVSFRQHNLQQASSGKPYDLILLRNVLIYFDGESKATVMRHVSARLRSGGWLILGGAETLNDRSSEFSYVRPTIYRKR